MEMNLYMFVVNFLQNFPTSLQIVIVCILFAIDLKYELTITKIT